MKTTVHLTLLSFILVAAVHGAAPRVTFVDPASPEAAIVRQTGEVASGQLAQRLVTELTAAMAAGGPEQAVEVCHTKALPLTKAPLSGLPQVTAVKRTSLRLRNPTNAPDPAERAALDHVAALIANGKPAPALLVQKVEADDAATEWRFYRSVAVQATCLACHGSPAAQSPTLRALLRERYPQDAATGYAEGDWRGLIRVTVQPSSDKPDGPSPRSL